MTVTEGLTFRAVARADLDWLSALNDDCLPAVNALEPEDLWHVVTICDYARIAWRGGDRLGVLTVIPAGVDHYSLNYRWFAARYDDFLYVDRIMVTGAARGLGVGRALYEDLFGHAAGRTTRVTCEVNSRPPNPASMRFHRSLGFEPVGEQEIEGGAKAVVLLSRSLAAASAP